MNNNNNNYDNCDIFSKFFEDKNGNIYTVYDVVRSIKICFGIDFEDKKYRKIFNYDICKFIDDLKIKYKNNCNDILNLKLLDDSEISVDKLILGNNSVSAVRYYYNKVNDNLKENENRISIVEARNYVKEREKELKDNNYNNNKTGDIINNGK